MRRLLPLTPLLLALLAPLLAGTRTAAEAGKTAGHFPLKDGDVWVMAGDSITAQHQHSNYFEAFCYARYPDLKFAFRNSGVGGHTIPSTLARFDYDIAAWKPTVVSVELGMNDKGGTPTDKFIANMGKMVERIRGIQARPVILAASPVNDGSTIAVLKGGNKRLDEYATALKGFCAEQKIPYADQFHALVDVWGNNKEVSLQGDAVHPGPPGQLMMAAALLKALGADGFVSSVSLDAEGKAVEAKGCKVSDAKAEGGKLSFDRLDERLPFPIPDQARAVLKIDPTILEMSRYTLKVSGLKEGDYELKVNGIPVARLTARDLGSGVNLTAFGVDPKAKDVNPIAGQGRAILNAVAAKEGLVGQWRNLSKQAHAANADPQLKEKLAALTEKVLEADAKIRAAAKPQKLHCELAPAGAP